jgi:hypothetical protein
MPGAVRILTFEIVRACSAWAGTAVKMIAHNSAVAGKAVVQAFMIELPPIGRDNRETSLASKHLFA